MSQSFFTMPLIDLFLLRPEAFRHACESQRAPLWISAFLFLVGIVYGVLVAFLQRTLGGELQGVPTAAIPLWILALGNILMGVIIAVLVHLGITLVAWLMAKAVGGPGYLVLLYRVTGYLLPLTLPALPALAFNTASTTIQNPVATTMPWLYLPLAAFGVALFLAGLYQALRVTQDLTPTRTAVAVALFAAFTASILSLA
jgi:uncharacterized membrane protein (DUF485 family)